MSPKNELKKPSPTNKKSIAQAQTEALLKKDCHKQRYGNQGRLRLFRIRNRKTRIHLKILGLCFTLGSLYYSFSTTNNYFAKLGFSNIGNSLMLTKISDIGACVVLIFFLQNLKRRLFIKLLSASIVGNLISFIFCSIFYPIFLYTFQSNYRY
jgi:hypothetical protein